MNAIYSWTKTISHGVFKIEHIRQEGKLLQFIVINVSVYGVMLLHNGRIVTVDSSDLIYERDEE